MGASDFILKPVNLDQLLLSAERALERRQLLIERREHQALLEQRVAEATRDLAAALRRAAADLPGHARGARLRPGHPRGRHRAALPPRPRLLAGPRARARAARRRARRAGPRRPAARHRQDRHPRRDPPQARPAHAGGVGDHAQRTPRSAGRSWRSIPFLRDAIPVVHHHHERWDGTGYPLGLAGREHPPRRAHLRDRRRLRRDDLRPALLEGHLARGGARSDPATRRAPTSIRTWSPRSWGCRSRSSRKRAPARPTRPARPPAGSTSRPRRPSA